MTLESVGEGDANGPYRILCYGVEGIGKTEYAHHAPKTVFIAPEDGFEHLPNAKRFPEPQDWQDVIDAVMELIEKPSPYQTLAIDTLDWLEPLLWAHICRQARKDNIEDFGYGKGYVKAMDEWRRLASLLGRLRKQRGMNIILLAHSEVKTWKNPDAEDFDRYQLKLHGKAAGFWKEWAGVVLFANHEIFAAKGERDTRAKGVSTGLRWLYTRRTATYDAKNRFNLPMQVRLGWDDFQAAVDAGRAAKPEVLRVVISEKLATMIDVELVAKVRAAMEDAGEDSSRLTRINERLDEVLDTLAQHNADAAQGE